MPTRGFYQLPHSYEVAWWKILDTAWTRTLALFDFVQWLRSAPITSTRPAHIPSVSTDSSLRHFDLSPVQAGGSVEAERTLVVRLACIFGHLIVKNY